jgi:hypothetical protein
MVKEMVKEMMVEVKDKEVVKARRPRRKMTVEELAARDEKRRQRNEAARSTCTPAQLLSTLKSCQSMNDVVFKPFTKVLKGIIAAQRQTVKDANTLMQQVTFFQHAFAGQKCHLHLKNAENAKRRAACGGGGASVGDLAASATSATDAAMEPDDGDDDDDAALAAESDSDSTTDDNGNDSDATVDDEL